jgi:hypothetical protein
MFHLKPAVAEFITLVSRRVSAPPKPWGLPVSLRVKEAMLLAVMICWTLAGRKALPLKMVTAVGEPCSEPSGVL